MIRSTVLTYFNILVPQGSNNLLTTVETHIPFNIIGSDYSWEASEGSYTPGVSCWLVRAHVQMSVCRKKDIQNEIKMFVLMTNF